MAFDLASATPVEDKPKKGGFDLASAKPAASVTAPKPAAPDKPAPMTRGGAGAAIAEPLMQMATGMVAKPLGDIAGLAAPFQGRDPEKAKRLVQEGMTYQPRTQEGQAFAQYNPLALIGKGIGHVADYARTGIKGDSANDSLRGMAGNAVGEGIEQAPGFLGAKLGKSAEIALPPKQAAVDAAKAGAKVADATRDTAQQAGYITPPEHGVKAAASGLAGQSKVDKVISAKNADNATARLGQEVGAPADAPLSKETLSNLKQKGYDAYNAMEQAAGPRLVPDRAFRDSFRQTIAKMDSDIALNPIANKELVPARDLLKSVADQPMFPTENTLRMIKSQRKLAKTDFRNGNSEMGTARLAVSEQLENLFENNLAKTGKQGLVDEFKAARVNLAKLNLLDRVVNEATGKVDLSKLAALSETKAYKGVLTGEFATAADFAKAYRKAAQKTSGEAVPRLGVFDLMFGAGSIASGSLPAMGAAAGEMATRVGVPALAERGMLQNRTPSYQVGPGARALPNALRGAGMGISEQAQQIPQPPR